MPTATWNVEWLSHNAQRNYPLTDDSTLTDESGAFVIPDDFLVYLDLPIHAGMDVDSGRFFVRHIGAYATGYSVIVGYQPDDGDPVTVASALIPRQTHVKNTAYALGGISPYDDTVGKVVIGRLDNIDLQPPGFWTFTLAGARLEPDAVRPIIRGVSSIVCVNGNQRSAPLRGTVELVAGQNVQLAVILAAGEDPVVRISAIEGEGTVEECLCEGDAALTDPIKTVNGIAPTPDGNFSVLGSDCVQITTVPNGLRLVNTCAKPCCGCAELEAITRDLERFGAQATAVEDFVDRLRSAVEAMDAAVLGSKTGDRGCVQCE